MCAALPQHPHVTLTLVDPTAVSEGRSESFGASGGTSIRTPSSFRSDFACEAGERASCSPPDTEAPYTVHLSQAPWHPPKQLPKGIGSSASTTTSDASARDWSSPHLVQQQQQEERRASETARVWASAPECARQRVCVSFLVFQSAYLRLQLPILLAVKVLTGPANHQWEASTGAAAVSDPVADADAPMSRAPGKGQAWTECCCVSLALQLGGSAVGPRLEAPAVAARAVGAGSLFRHLLHLLLLLLLLLHLLLLFLLLLLIGRQNLTAPCCRAAFAHVMAQGLSRSEVGFESKPEPVAHVERPRSATAPARRGARRADFPTSWRELRGWTLVSDASEGRATRCLQVGPAFPPIPPIELSDRLIGRGRPLVAWILLPPFSVMPRPRKEHHRQVEHRWFDIPSYCPEAVSPTHFANCLLGLADVG
mmetsp:Transcript_27534/g.58543  ORF Transcript_27534/g.58543 Transcript_27534/m.58543 type:complete len:424 (-) Transcript_27534:293-1564(-)